MGRVNYGSTITDRKGITKKVEVIVNNQTTDLKNWDVTISRLIMVFPENLNLKQPRQTVHAWYRATFNVTKLGDTFLDMSSWGKGMIWVNGHNMGRYWNIGPQQTIYMPGCWLRKGSNEVVVLDLETPTSAYDKRIGSTYS